MPVEGACVHRAGPSFRTNVDEVGRIAVSPDSLAGLAHATAGAAPDAAVLVAALAAGSRALAGLASGAALAEAASAWVRRLDALQVRWQDLSREVSRAGLDYVEIDTELAS